MDETWAIVELMGHVRLAGRLTEEEKFGTKMGRLDIPKAPNADCASCHGSGRAMEGELFKGFCPECGGFVTQYFGGGSVYRITFVTEEVARHVAKSASPAPVSTWDFPKRLAASPVVASPANDDEREWDDDSE